MASATADHINQKHKINSKLYHALRRREESKVVELCRQVPDGGCHPLTVQGSTVLHRACYARLKDLVLNLLKELPQNLNHKLLLQNAWGNSLLFEACSCDEMLPVAEELLSKAPQLITIRNNYGETVLFRAARNGASRLLRFLEDEVGKAAENETQCRELYRRYDNSTILHVAVLTEFFDFAFRIASEHEDLICAVDNDQMTALQLLVCNTLVFRRPKSMIGKLIYRCLSTEATFPSEGYIIPVFESIRKQKKAYESALKLAKFLIERDTSWEMTKSPIARMEAKAHSYGSFAYGDDEEKQREKNIAETPLYLAAKIGCTEIVNEILEMYPQAIDYIDYLGRNILHVAIQFRQMEIIDIIETKELELVFLKKQFDDQGNSVLHYVGIQDMKQAQDMRSPALILQEELLLYERVKNMCPHEYIQLINPKGKTAWDKFTETNAKLHADAKDWIKRTAENCSIIAVLIATVAFAAAYTVPGGSNQETGYPVLLNEPLFIIFAISDVVSLTLSLASVIAFLSILTSPFRFKDFRQSLIRKLLVGVSLLIFSVSMMMMSFAATVILLIRNKIPWTRIAVSAVAFVPVVIFTVSYLPLYVNLMKSFAHSMKEYFRLVFPKYRRRISSASVNVMDTAGESDGATFLVLC